LSYARGEFVAWIDADDVFAATRIQRCVEFLKASPVDWVTTDAVVFVGDASPLSGEVSVVGTHYELNNLEFPPPDRQLAEFINHDFAFGEVVIRRSAIASCGAFDPTFSRAVDYDFLFRLLLRKRHGALIAEPLAYYRRHPNSLSADSSAHWHSHLAVLEHHLPQAVRQLQTGWGRACYHVATAARADGRLTTARQFFRLAARDPGLRPLTRTRIAARALLTVRCRRSAP
jgi:hypothetical protein